MGAIGGLVGLGGGNSGTGYSTPSGTNSGQLQTAYTGAQNAMTGQQGLLTALQGQNGLQNQSQVYGQLQGIANGSGPNPAQAMLNQSTGQNVSNQAALMAGQRGASQNVGLMARQAAQQGAQIQQTAAGQGASMQAQQSLNALNSAGQMANTQASNQIGQTNANVQSQQGEQSTLQGANTANNAVQGQLANTTMQGQQGLIGGGLQAGAAALGLADGGQVPGIQASSAFGPQSMFGQALSAPTQAGTPSFGGSDSLGAQSLQNGVAAFGKKKTSNPASGATSMQASNDTEFGSSSIGDSGVSGLEKLGIMAAAEGGKVPAMVSPGERIIPPEKVKSVAEGKVSPMKVGTQVPGTPKVKGNSYANDTVPAKLPEGGFVIPNDIMQSKNPEANAAKFVRDFLAKKGKRA